MAKSRWLAASFWARAAALSNEKLEPLEDELPDLLLPLELETVFGFEPGLAADLPLDEPEEYVRPLLELGDLDVAAPDE